MWWTIIASLLSLPAVPALETVTVCRNTYGSDFLIQVVPLTSALGKRQDTAVSGYLDQSGSISPKCRQGSIWNLNNGQLSCSGEKVSVSKDIAFTQFSTSVLLKAENTKFATTDAFLFWDNGDFQDGTARFCAGLGDNASLTAVFSGPIPVGCVPASLRTVQLSSCNRPAPSSTGNLTILSPSTLGISTVKGSESGRPINFTTLLVPTSSPYVPGPSTSYPFITGVPAPSQKSSSISILSSISRPFITGVPAPSQKSSSISISNSTSYPFITGVPSPSQNSSSISISNSTSYPFITGVPSPSQNSSSTSISNSTSYPFITGVPSPSQNSASTGISNSTSYPFITGVPSPSQNSSSTSISNSTSYPFITGVPAPSQNVSSTSIFNTISTISNSSSSSFTPISSPSPSVPSFRLASSIINSNRYIPWCSSYLGYVNATSQATVTVDLTTTVETTATIIPAIQVTTELLLSTKVSTLVTPSDSITVDVTPSASVEVTATVVDTERSTETITATTDDFSQVIQKRLVVSLGLTTPAALQGFDPNDISSACSANVPTPSPLAAATVLRTFTDLHTQLDTVSQGHRTIEVNSEVEMGITIESGDFRTTETKPPKTYQFTTTITRTENIDATATVTVTNTIPTVILAHPTAIIGSVNGSIMDYDDFAYNLTTPFEMQMYGHNSDQIWVSTNGILSLDTGSWYYRDNAPLPRALPIPNYSMFPFWDDTYIFQGQPQGIYYEVTGGGNGTRIAFEFYLSHYHSMTQYYHYTVSYDSANPGVFIFKYYQVSDNGTSATVGMQDYNANKFTQYSFNNPVIYPGLELTLDSNAQTITASTFDTSGNTTSSTG